MGMSVEAFMKANDPGRALRGSKLDDYSEQLTALFAKEYTITQILEWLAENDVECTRQTVTTWRDKNLTEGAPRRARAKK